MLQWYRLRQYSAPKSLTNCARRFSPIGSSYGRRLRVEELEDRRLLAVFSVTNLSDSGAGSLRDAITQANSTPDPDEIIFAGDASSGTIALSSGELEITEPLTITGPGQELLTVDAQHTSRILNFSSSTGDLTVSGLTIQNGYSTYSRDKGSGGGIRFYSSDSLALTDVTVRKSTSDANGGGINAPLGAVTLTGSNVTENTSTLSDGGGIYSFSGSVTVVDSTVSGNISGRDGGGIATYSGTVTLTDSTVSGNTSHDNGGGIFKFNLGALMLTNSTVSGNTSAADGGGIFSYFGNVSLYRSTVSGNKTTGEDAEGGGIYIGVGLLSLNDTTVTGNLAAEALGGGVFVAGSNFFDPPVTIQNSILAGNSAYAAPDFWHASGSTLALQYSLIGEGSSTILSAAPIGSADPQGNLIGTAIDPIDPLLAPLADNGGPTKTHMLLPSSPALDAGSTAFLTDQRGLANPVDFASAPNTRGGNGSDMGSLEVQTIASTVLPDGVTVQFETLSELRLSQLLLIDEPSSPLNLTLSVSAGIFDMPADGTALGVTAFQTNPQTVVLTGDALAINSYFDTAAQLRYTPAAGAFGANAAAIDVTVYDGATSTHAGTISVDVAELPSLVVTTTADSENELDFETSLREAIRLANATAGADMITFEASLSGQSILLTGGQLSITDTLEIDASSLDHTVTINAQQQSRVLAIDAPLIDEDDFDVTLKGLTISGGDSDFSNGAGILFSSGGNLNIVGSSVRNNITEGNGGGIYAPIGVVTLNGSNVSGNTGQSGGAIFTNIGPVMLTASTVSGNSTNGNYGDGGGIRTFSGAVTLVDSAVIGNEVIGTVPFAAGGGIYTHSGSVFLTGSTVSGNTSGYLGGGIFTLFDTVTLASSTVSENSSYSGAGGINAGGSVTLDDSTVARNSTNTDFIFAAGGIRTWSGDVTLNNSTISGNTSGSNGGGITTFAGAVTLNNSTVTENAATRGVGGGIYIRAGNSNPLLTIRNSIVGGNSANDAPDLQANSGSVLDVDFSLIGDTTGGLTEAQIEGITSGVGNLLDIDPLLGPLTDNGGPTQTHALLPASPAINAGDPGVLSSPTEFDQRGNGFIRVETGRIDIGAYESQIIPSADFDSDGDVDGADFLAWQRGFGRANAGRSDGNSDDDSDTDASDLAAWQVNYGGTATLSPQVNVPTRYRNSPKGNEYLIDMAFLSMTFESKSNTFPKFFEQPNALEVAFAAAGTTNHSLLATKEVASASAAGNSGEETVGHDHDRLRFEEELIRTVFG